jgi:autotransporter strand-loop-strand O-heptosyltransferase
MNEDTDRRLTPPSIVAIDLTSGSEPARPESSTPPALSAESAAAAPIEGAPFQPTDTPTQEGPRGLRYDFNNGCRLLMPESAHPWRVRLSDLDTGNVLFETELKSGRVNSTKRYFIRFRIEVWQNGEALLTHDYSAAGRDVMIRFPVDTLGDPLGWFPYAVKFKEHHGCRLTCAMSSKIIPLLRDSYPDINFVTFAEANSERFYASYVVAVYFVKGTIYDYKDCVPLDFRLVGLHRAAGYILGVDPTEKRPRIAIGNDTRPLEEPYVCIAVQSTLQAKFWNNPTGWREVVTFLKNAGYRVICIDQKTSHGQGLVWTHIPAGAEDMTGDHPLAERARWIKHADFFVGLSSGLSWLAWAVGTPVVMISGLTHPSNEFFTPYRVINYNVCNGCWNDPTAAFDRHDFLTCPRHKDTPRQFECTRLITAEQVKATLRSVPGFGRNAKSPEFAVAAATAPGRIA